MMLAEAGICGNRGVADGGPFVGLGLLQPMCAGGGVGWGGSVLDRASFFTQISLAGQIIESDLASCGITVHSEKTCQ